MAESPELTQAIQQGDPEAIGSVVQAALPGLVRVARATGLTREAAEDVVQEAVLVFLRRAGDFDGRARASTWLHGILANKLRESRRAASRRPDGEDIDAVVEARFRPDGRWAKPPLRPDQLLSRRELRHVLGQCIDTVSSAQRQAFVLREVEGFTTDEVCKIIDVTANNLGVLLFRARNRLRECVERHLDRSDVDAEL